MPPLPGHDGKSQITGTKKNISTSFRYNEHDTVLFPSNSYGPPGAPLFSSSLFPWRCCPFGLPPARKETILSGCFFLLRVDWLPWRCCDFRRWAGVYAFALATGEILPGVRAGVIPAGRHDAERAGPKARPAVEPPEHPGSDRRRTPLDGCAPGTGAVCRPSGDGFSCLPGRARAPGSPGMDLAGPFWEG